MPFLLLFLLITSFVSAADPYRFEVKTIAEDFARPMGMDLGPDGSIYLIELQGKVNRIHPKTGKRTILAEIEVFGEQENGLLGIALDPIDQYARTAAKTKELTRHNIIHGCMSFLIGHRCKT